MKTKMLVVVIAMFVLSMSVNSFAQMGSNPQERMKKALEDYKTRLKLTDTQFAKLDTILKDQMNEMTKLRESSNGDRQAKMAAFTGLREKTDKKIETILTTDEQKAEYKKIKDERAQRMQQRG